MAWYYWVICIIVFDLVIGFFIQFGVNSFCMRSFEDRELIAIAIFWPIIGIVVGIIGFISLVTSIYKDLLDDMEDEE